MTLEIDQEKLFKTPDVSARVQAAVADLLKANQRPSANELLGKIEALVGVQARLVLLDVLHAIRASPDFTGEQKSYLAHLIASGELADAIQGSTQKDKQVESSVDQLLRSSAVYRSSKEFRETVQFMGRFRDYAPYNNMLVRVQNPSCSFYASAKDWRLRFERWVKEDARPMLILAPMNPVMLVYDLDSTDGKPIPEQLANFGRFIGEWESKWLHNLVENADRHKVRVDFKTLSTTHAGFAQFQRHSNEFKARIVVHDELDEPSKFGVLCHELAHVLLGHLGGDTDRWWPARGGIGRAAAEVEAEAVAYIVTTRFGLTGESATYLSGYVRDHAVPTEVSLDTIAKVASRIEQMAKSVLPVPRALPPKKSASVKRSS